MKEFSAKTWNKVDLNFLNRLKEIKNCVQELTGRSGHPTDSVKQLLSKFPPMRRFLRFPRPLTSRTIVFIRRVESSNVILTLSWTSLSYARKRQGPRGFFWDTVQFHPVQNLVAVCHTYAVRADVGHRAFFRWVVPDPYKHAWPTRDLPEFGRSWSNRVTKQYNLVPANGRWRWCLAAGKVTVGLASHWPCVTDNIVVLPPTGSWP